MANGKMKEMKVVTENKAPALEDVLKAEVGNLNQLAKIDDATEEARHEANAENGKPDPGRSLAPLYPFVNMATDLDSIVQAARIQFNEADNNLKQAEAYAEHLRQSIHDKARELADMESRLRDFGKTVISAHNKFHGNNPEEQR